MDEINPASSASTVDMTKVGAMMDTLAGIDAVRETTVHQLVRYLSEHAPSTCEYAEHFDCTKEVDGLVLLSCGHHVFTCERGGGRLLSSLAARRAVVCTRTDDGLHAAHAIVTSRTWQGLS